MRRLADAPARILLWTIVVATVLTASLAPSLATSPASATPPLGSSGREVFRPPTSGVVIDPFRPPPKPWLSGNRGIEYATEPGSPLIAIGTGTVSFAGQVAGRLVVSITHQGGLRSSLTGVGQIKVQPGESVRGGQVVGEALDTVHLGVRRGDTYIDPESLWGRDVSAGRAYLVALDDEPDDSDNSDGSDPPDLRVATSSGSLGDGAPNRLNRHDQGAPLAVKDLLATIVSRFTVW